MNNETASLNQTVYYRLIALWAVCEAFAGGMLHAFKIPFTGMMINSMSVICIILIATFHRGTLSILKATIIVAIFKMMLSPHSPPTAYIALFFQGTLGQMLFASQRFKLMSCILLANLTLVESSIQRILVMVLVYGSDFWIAVDAFIARLTGNDETTSYSIRFAIVYVSIHFVFGILVGYYAYRLSKQVSAWVNAYPNYLLDETKSEENTTDVKKKRKKRWLLMLIWMMLLFLYVQSLFYPENAIISKKDVLNIVLRSALILLAWYLFLSPLLKKFIHHLLDKQKAKMAVQVAAVSALIPLMQRMFVFSWKKSSEQKGMSRLKLFSKILLLNVLHK